MGKPSQTNATQTTVNPAQVAQQPYLNDVWGQAQSLYQNNPQTYYPGQTLAGFRPPDPLLTSGYQNIYNAGQNVNAALPQYNQNYNNLTQYTPQMAGYANQAAQNNNAGMQQLANTASGAYLNSNPYINAAIQAAQDPVTRNYQTSIAPTMDAALSSSGRYGSGAQAGLYDTSQRNLARGLGDISTNMMNANYARERQAQDAAAQNYGQLYNSGLGLGISGLNNASAIQQQQLSMFPQWAQSQGLGAQAELQAGKGLTGISDMYRQYEQQQIADQMARYYGQQQAPWQGLQQYSGLIGQPAGGSQSQTTPYFSNPMGSAISGIAGLAGAGSSLASAASAAPAALAAWIVCTELMRQGRMPKLWWLTGTAEFAAYPEVIRRGYYTWAIPSVRHLRAKPSSLYSRFLGRIFYWRAEDIAARAGVAEARRLWRGRAVTAALWLPCLVIGALVSEQDWRQVYRKEQQA